MGERAEAFEQLMTLKYGANWRNISPIYVARYNQILEEEQQEQTRFIQESAQTEYARNEEIRQLKMRVLRTIEEGLDVEGPKVDALTKYLKGVLDVMTKVFNGLVKLDAQNKTIMELLQVLIKQLKEPIIIKEEKSVLEVTDSEGKKIHIPTSQIASIKQVVKTA